MPYRTIFEGNPVGLCLVREGQIASANPRFAAVFGYDPEALVGTPLASLIADAERERVQALLDRVAKPSYGDARRIAFEGIDSSGDGVDVELYAARTEAGVVCTVHDATERRDRERRLAALHGTTREMMRTRRPETIAEAAVDTAVEVLDPLVASVYLYDHGAGELRSAASASQVGSVTAGEWALDDVTPIAWQVFVRGSSSVVDDVFDHGAVDPPEDTPVRSLLAIPLGDHGVFVVGNLAPRAFDEVDVQFAETLSTTSEVALDRADRERTAAERTDRLREQNEALDRLRRIDAVVREVLRILVGATTRQEIERAVCERLAAVEDWTFAWIGERRVTDEGIVPRTWAGEADDFLEVVAARSEGAPFADTPAEQALATGDPQAVEDVVTAHESGGWRDTALEFGFGSVVSVPLVHEHREYGVLEVYGDGPGAFDDPERELLADLGAIVAYAIHAVERERALLGGGGVELEVRIDEPGSFLPRLAGLAEATVRVDGVVADARGGYLAYVAVDRPVPPAEVDALADRTADVDAVRPIGDGDDRYEVRLSASRLFETVATHGGTPREVVVDESGATVRITLPGTAGIRAFVEALRGTFPDLAVLAQRTPEADADDLQTGITDRLTDRQREVLSVAYHSGFYEWPRTSTGEEIADSLGVAPPTLHKHLRIAERKILSSVLDERGG